jgi:hypothetical protein
MAHIIYQQRSRATIGLRNLSAPPGYESPMPIRFSKGAFFFLEWFAHARKRADFAIECN